MTRVKKSSEIENEGKQNHLIKDRTRYPLKSKTCWGGVEVKTLQWVYSWSERTDLQPGWADIRPKRYDYRRQRN